MVNGVRGTVTPPVGRQDNKPASDPVVILGDVWHRKQNKQVPVLEQIAVGF